MLQPAPLLSDEAVPGVDKQRNDEYLSLYLQIADDTGLKESSKQIMAPTGGKSAIQVLYLNFGLIEENV